MNVGEPTGYENEPRENFHELPPELHSRFYHYERLGHDLTAECRYYTTQLTGRCRKVLDLGCGTSLLSGKLRRHGFEVTGVDISKEALVLADSSPGNRLVQMDMRKLGFRPCFEAVIIAQNTLNLLTDETTIRHCLREVKRVLKSPGLLLAHLHCTEPEQQEIPEERFLQFQMFDHPEGGTIIKETIKSVDFHKKLLVLEERYKIRRFNTSQSDTNHRHYLTLAALTRKQWLELFDDAGFTIEFLSAGFDEQTLHPSSTLHLVARAS